MSIQTLTNTAVEFYIGDKQYKVKKLSIREIYDIVERKIKSDYFNNIADMAKLLGAEDRPDFLKSSMQGVPSGSKLESMVGDSLNTTEGALDLMHIILNKMQKVSMEEIEVMSKDNSLSDQLSIVINYATGTEKESNSVDAKSGVDSEKKALATT